MTAAALAAIADLGPGGVSGRAIARDAEVHHEQIQQMFGSVDELVAHAVQTERDRFISISFPVSPGLPDPLAAGDHPLFWRSIAQVLLDPGPVSLRTLAEGGPVDLIRRRLAAAADDRDEMFEMAIAGAWAAAPLGALIFKEPLRRGLEIADSDWDTCWSRLGDRLCSLAEVSGLAPPQSASPLPQEMAGTSEPDRGRERLLSAAEGLLAKHLETTITGRELAAAANVNYGLVNHYFGSKTSVFDEALVHLHEMFLNDVLDVVESVSGAGAFEVFARHRTFLRSWASRLLGERPTPNFELLGMQRLMNDLLDLRSIRADDARGRLEAAADAMSSVALQLGWTILRPLPTAIDPRGLPVITEHLQSISTWLLDHPPSTPPT